MMGGKIVRNMYSVIPKLNKFEKLVHLVGFTIEIYYDARLYERQIWQCKMLWTLKFPPGKFISLYFQLDTLFFRLRTISAILFPLHVSGLTGPSSGGLNCTCSLWYSPPLEMSLHDKDIYRGGEYHRLHVQFRPPDDGPLRPETCRGKRIADIVRRRKNIVSSWK